MTRRRASMDRPVAEMAAPSVAQAPRARAASTSAPRGRETDQLLSRRTELVLRELDSLPTLPAVATRLIELGARDDVEVREIVRLIETDPTLTAKLLSLCRRAATRTRYPITTVEMAVVMLGLEAVRSLVLSVQVFEWAAGTPRKAGKRRGGGSGVGGPAGVAGSGGRSAADDPTTRFDRTGFWQHSIAVACCAELIAREHHELEVQPEEAFVCGLVHDLGKLALDLVLPKAYGRVIELSELRRGNIADFERPIVGLDHHAAGQRLAERWGLPDLLRDVMGMHHLGLDALAKTEHRRTIAVVGLADAIARKLSLGWSGNHAVVEGEREQAAEAGLKWERIEAIIPRVYEATSTRCKDLGLGEEPSQKLLVESILRANARLGRLNQELSDANQALEDAQQQLTEARALARLGEMTAGAAHEMNNPLAVVSGRAQSLLKSVETDSERGLAQAIVDAAGRLSGLIHRLNRIAAPPKPSFHATDLKGMLEQVIVRAKAKVVAKGTLAATGHAAAGVVGAIGGGTTPRTGGVPVLGIKLTVADGLGPARLDKELFADALTEIVVNAIESSPKTVVEVRASTESTPTGDCLVVQVADDGQGMSERALAHATDPFFSEKPAGRQTGLGLALAHRLLQTHQATLRMESRVGRGTTVTVAMPNWRWSAHISGRDDQSLAA